MNGYLKPIMPVRAFERAISQIANAIRMGEIRPGDRLPSERDIAATMEISRPSLRQALRVLEDAGVIDVRPGSAGGIFVASTMIPRDLLGRSVLLTPDDIRAVLESRRLFEPRVAHLAAVRATQEDFDRLQRTLDEQQAILDAAGDDEDESFACQSQHFHVRLAGATHNGTIIEMSLGLQARLEWVRAHVGGSSASRVATLDLHERTMSAIRLADHEQIERVMEEHVSVLELAWERKSSRPLVRKMPDFLVPSASDRPDHQ